MLRSVNALDQIPEYPAVYETFAIKEQLQKAAQCSSVPDRKAAYEEAFKLLVAASRKGPLSKEIQEQLVTLLENYAHRCCYAQGPGDEGFRKSARLMEFSLELQLKYSGNLANPKELEKYDSLEAISLSGRNLSQVEQLLQSDPEQISRFSSGTGLAATLIRLCFSYQNMNETRGNLNLQEKLQAITLACIGNETDEQFTLREDFLYNRCLYLAVLKDPNDHQSQIHAYDGVLELTNIAYRTDIYRLQSRIAQIKNMQGLTTMRLKKEEGIAQALPLFEEAFRLRSALLDQFPEALDNADQKFLLNNIRTSLVQIYVLNDEKEKALEHKNALQSYLKELDAAGDEKTYRGSYLNAIALFTQKYGTNSV